MKNLCGLIPALFGALLLGALSTVGDMIWDAWIRSNRIFYALIHGAVICVAIGLVLGLSAGGGKAIKRGVTFTPVIGVVAAGSFYLLATFMGWWAMFVCWLMMWVSCAWVHQSMQGETKSKTYLVRGLLASLVSGLAFYGISGIWTNPPTDPNYLIYFAYWSLAFFPAFAILFLKLPNKS